MLRSRLVACVCVLISAAALTAASAQTSGTMTIYYGSTSGSYSTTTTTTTSFGGGTSTTSSSSPIVGTTYNPGGTQVYTGGTTSSGTLVMGYTAVQSSVPTIDPPVPSVAGGCCADQGMVYSGATDSLGTTICTATMPGIDGQPLTTPRPCD